MRKINLDNITLHNMGQWPVLIKASVLLSVLLSIIFLGYWLKIQESFIIFNRLKNQEAVLKEKFEAKQKHLLSFKKYTQQIQELNGDFTELLKLFSEQKELPDLLDDVSQTGLDSGLGFKLFAPQIEILHDFYVESPVRISVIGDYFQLAVFLSRVSSKNRVITFDDLSIERLTSSKLLMNITVKLYRRTQ